MCEEVSVSEDMSVTRTLGGDSGSRLDQSLGIEWVNVNQYPPSVDHGHIIASAHPLTVIYKRLVDFI